jgi:riboflavin-specific deaminase-like protein
MNHGILFFIPSFILICSLNVSYAFSYKAMVSHVHAFLPTSTPRIIRTIDTSKAKYHAIVTALHSHEEIEPPISLPQVTGITLKMAFDSNYAVADKSESKSERFTCPESLDLVHKLRRCSDAVLVGRSTVEIDDCTLTVRRVPLFQGKRKPARVVIDPTLKICKGDVPYKIVMDDKDDDYETMIYHSQKEYNAESTFPNMGSHVQFIYLPSLDTKHIVQDLNSRGIQHIMVEGGPSTALKFLKEGMVDRAIFIRAPLRFIDPVPSGITDKLMNEVGLYLIDTRPSGDDTVEYWIREGTDCWPGGLDVGSWPC